MLSVVVDKLVAVGARSCCLVGLLLAVLNNLVAQLSARSWIHRQIRNFPAKILEKNESMIIQEKCVFKTDKPQSIHLCCFCADCFRKKNGSKCFKGGYLSTKPTQTGHHGFQFFSNTISTPDSRYALDLTVTALSV